ncbi:MAG TPA: hypothetical protein VNZ03_31335 [Terriglobales bacterium]|nr:hypothetical protein [Terriglobales bacterium]
MKHSSRPTRTPANLSKSMHHQLSAYALAASAAGVGILALPQPAAAKIVYTPAHTHINGDLSLDLNHDGIVDYEFYEHKYNSVFWEMWVRGGKNQVLASGPHASFAAALPAGVRLGAKRKWATGYGIMVGWSGTSTGNTNTGTRHYGPWFNVHHRYMGFKFLMDGHFHYGWARLNVTMANDLIDAVLTGYAYETIPNKPIITGKTKGSDEIDSIAQPNPVSVTTPIPKPATLGTLALGMPGLSIWRRKESAESAQ